MSFPKTCSECGGDQLSWACHPIKLTDVVDGRLRMHEIGVEFYLGCDECSATLDTRTGDEIANILNLLPKLIRS